MVFGGVLGEDAGPFELGSKKNCGSSSSKSLID